ncbi:MAG TPA: benzoate/H(+) symporter BenE family transporter [Dehalococcoidia bacterium]
MSLDARHLRPSQPPSLADLNSANVWAGITAFIFMVFGALTVQLSVVRLFGISEAQMSSWITITWLTAAVVSLPLALYYRQPLAIGWTIPGLVYLGSLAGEFTFAEIAFANAVAGLAMLAIGFAGLGSRIVSLIPLPILMAMFAASILEYETKLVNTTVNEAEIAVPMVVAYLVGRLLNHRQVPPVGLAVGAGLIATTILGRFGHLTIESTLPTLQSPSFSFSIEALLTVSIPMVVLVLGLGNVQGLGFMISEGYKPPLNVVTGLVGVMTTVNAVFGGHPASMARTVTAMVSGRDAGALDKRYWASFVAFVPALGVALATGLVVAVIGSLPAAFVATMAGLAILSPFQDAMTRAFSGDLVFGCVIAFVVTLSTFTLAGIPPAFWALIAGIGASALLERHQLMSHWKRGLAPGHSPLDHVVESMEIRRWEGLDAGPEPAGG